MNKKELKQIIGNQAETIIVSDLNLVKKNGGYNCPVTKHNQDNHRFIWYRDSFQFFCHDCNGKYDIWNHAETKADSYKYLCDLAGVECKEKVFNTILPVTKEVSETGKQYLANRGIKESTMDKYKVRCDNQWIYFNYATPDFQLVATKHRNIYEKRFNATKNGTSILYGMHLLKNQHTLIICEGEIDALSLYQITCDMGKESEYLCSSLPNGSKSLNSQLIDNCSHWLDRFERIIFIPDNDNAGQRVIESIRALMSNYDVAYASLPCKDVNEYYMDADTDDTKILEDLTVIEPILEHCEYADKLPTIQEKNGHSSGFITVDYNMNGLKDGWVTLVTGLRGDGKTTFTRQMLLAYAKQGLKSFMFCGEARASRERDLLARLSCNTNDIIRSEGTGGRSLFEITEKTRDEFNKQYGNMIILSDMDKVKNKQTYETVFLEMKKMVKLGVKLFVIDNLMKITIDCKGGEVFDKQRQVITDLKVFAQKHNVHIVLIAHPNKTGEKISGAQEVENTADAILRYQRVKDPSKDAFLQKADLPPEIRNNISALVTTEKVRDEGTYNIALIEWDSSRGAVINVSNLPMALDYEAKGMWTKAFNRYSDNDIPDDYRGNASLNGNLQDK